MLTFRTLAIDPWSPKTLYGSRPIGGLFRSTNEGRDWTECFPSADPILSLAFPPTQKNLLYAGGLSGLYRSLDSGATWSPLDHLPEGVNSVLVSATDATTLMVGATEDRQQSGASCLEVDPGQRPTAAELAEECDSICYIPPVRELGIVNNYIAETLGFIRSNDGEGVFFHTQNVVGARPPQGREVWFTKFPGLPRPRAIPVVPLREVPGKGAN